MKKGFTLIEIVIVLVVIGILMAATMRFGSGRIVDLKAQSLKEDFVGYYNEIYNQNMTSSYRDQKHYQGLTMSFNSGMSFQIDDNPVLVAPHISVLTFRGLILDTQTVSSSVQIQLVPYILWCILSSQGITGNIFSFQLYVPQNDKQYCFEIKSETCKLVEIRCTE